MPFVGLNPSIADVEKDDLTIKKCIRFAELRGADGVVMLNLFALVSTSPKALLSHPDPIGPDNDLFLRRVLSTAKEAIVCWGCSHDLKKRDRDVLEMIPSPICLGVTKDGFPRHPSRLGYATKFQRYEKQANQALEPTLLLVTDRAFARSAPSSSVAHL